MTREQQRAVFGTRVRQLRQAQGWSQTTLAVHLGVAKTAVAGWEQGANAASEANVVKLERLLNLQPGELGCLLGQAPLPPVFSPEAAIEADLRMSARDKRIALATIAALRQQDDDPEREDRR